jgi:hypothetical protein
MVTRVRSLALAILVLACAPAWAWQFLKGPARSNVTLLGGKSMTGVHGQASVEAIGFEWGRGITKHNDLMFGVMPFSIQQPKSWFGSQFGEGEEQVRAIHWSIVLRHNWGGDATRSRPYAELGSGPMWAQKRVPAATSHFNFNSHGEVGMTFASRRGIAPFAGFRFQHISNGGYAPRNSGLNISTLVFGLRSVR